MLLQIDGRPITLQLLETVPMMTLFPFFSLQSSSILAIDQITRGSLNPSLKKPMNVLTENRAMKNEIEKLFGIAVSRSLEANRQET